jgi:SH3 domain
MAKYDFEGSVRDYFCSNSQISLKSVCVFQDPDDLPFKRGDILTVMVKDEDQWWTAKNSVGQVGSIPVPYIQKVSNLKSCCVG